MGKWGEMGGNGEIVSIAHGMWVVGCRGPWRHVVKGNGTKMGPSWGEMGQKNAHFSHPHFPHFSGGLPHNSLCKNQLTALTNGKWEMLQITDTHRHDG